MYTVFCDALDCYKIASIVQLAEQLICNQQVPVQIRVGAWEFQIFSHGIISTQPEAELTDLKVLANNHEHEPDMDIDNWSDVPGRGIVP